MAYLQFNFYYNSLKASLKLKNIYRNQFKLVTKKIILLYFFLLPAMLISFSLTTNEDLRYNIIFGLTCIILFLIFFYIERYTLNTALTYYENLFNLKLIFPDKFDQFKYYLWRNEIKNNYSIESIDNTLKYIDIESIKYDMKNLKYNTINMLIISVFIIGTLWRYFDSLNLTYQVKILFYTIIIYFSYHLLLFKLSLQNKQKNLLLLKQFLLRLKSEMNNVDEIANGKTLGCKQMLILTENEADM